MDYMNIEETLNDKYCGKRVTCDLSELADQDPDFEWDEDYSKDDQPVSGGTGVKTLDYRGYLDKYDLDEDEDEDDERRSWNISTCITITVSDEMIITEITIDASVTCWGDSGLGDCDPEEEWTEDDIIMAEKFLDSITDKE